MTGYGTFLSRLHWGRLRKLPMVLQTEAAECALACLAMIARYHGHDVDLLSLRRRYPTSLKGANLARVIEMASRLGFETRPLRLELEKLSKLKVPCILHWDLNHFVVLKQNRKHGAVIHDPARGVLKLSRAEISKHFTGVALECRPGADFKPLKARESISLRSLTGGVERLPGALVQIFGLALALEVFALAGPFYLQWVIDQVLVAYDRDLLTLLGIGFVLIALFESATLALRGWSITWLSAALNVRWTSNLFSHLLKLPLDWYEKRHVGDVVSRFDSMHTIQQTLTTRFVSAILDGIMASVTLVVLGFYSVKLTLIVLGAFALYVILRWVAFTPLRRAQEDQIAYEARQQTELLEAIRGAQTLKLHNQQPARTSHYANTVVETVNRTILMQRLNIAFTSGNRLIFGIGRVVLIWLAALLALDGRFTAGMLVAFVTYADQFTTRGASLIDKGIQFRMLRLHAERVADIALAEPERYVESKLDVPLQEAALEVRDVSFRYASGEPWVLRHCSLIVEPGESIGLMGPSGQGKTTLAKIMLGLLEPEEGEVLYGGIDIRRIGLARYRDQVAAVMQEDQLLGGSIADNIACFDNEPSLLRVQAVARLTAIHDDIVAMPMGYESLVGDMGSALSGGQKQRLLIARALYREPKLLVLDEATSSLDIEHEQQVNAAISRLTITRIVISHRPSTMANMKRVLTVAAGTLHSTNQWIGTQRSSNNSGGVSRSRGKQEHAT